MHIKILFASLASVMLLAACSKEPEPSAQPESTASTKEFPKRAAPRADRNPTASSAEIAPAEDDQPLIAAPRLYGQSPVPGDGLNLMIFASNRQEYKESLRLIAEQTSDEQFQQLDAAIRYLMINDPSIMNDEQRLFEAINGKTGMEVLQMTADLLNNRAR